MGRRIQYRSGPSKEQIAAAINAMENRRKSQNALIVLSVIGALALVAIVGGGLFWFMSSQQQKEFGSLTTACERKGVNVSSTYARTSGKHPAVAFKRKSGRWQIDFIVPGLGSSLLPDDIVARSLAETQIVLCLGPVYEVFIERCPYTANDRDYTNAVERYYLKQEAQLIEAKTGRTVSTEIFTGSSPRYCQKEEGFSSKSKIVKLIGTEPSEDDVQAWAQTHLVVK